MDGIKEILDAFNARIRSPIFGSVAIAFVFINWKPLFYLAFAEKTAEEKFLYFDEQTNFWLLFAIPFLLGLAFAIAAPWIALVSSRIAERPTSTRKILQIESTHKSLIRKQELEQTRKEMIAEAESALIETAKRDEAVKSIEDPEIREDLQRQIDDVRASTLGLVRDKNDMSPTQRRQEEIGLIQTRLKMYRDQREAFRAQGDSIRMGEMDNLIEKEIGLLSKI